MPAHLKPPHLRQRRNKKSTSENLEAPEKPKIPALPKIKGRKWNRLTRDWWDHVWRSPMASVYIETDVDGLGRLAVLVDDFYMSSDPKLMAEIRLQESRFGLTPSDRARLQWEIGKIKSAEKRKPKSRKRTADPRKVLKIVK